MSNIMIKEKELKALVVKKLSAAGLDEKTSKQVADVLVFADSTGVHSHGVMRVEHYCNRIAQGGMNVTPEFSVEQISPSLAVFDCDDGMGHSGLIAATEHAIKLASETGLGWVSVKNASHCGALAYYMNKITEQNMIGIAMTQTDTCVAPYGGAEKFLGTNPIAFGFPVEGSTPMIHDLATSATAFGKLLFAKEVGKQIEPDVAIDKDGNMTTDPNQVESLLAFGGHKGSGIALCIDALTGILMGANFSNHVHRMYGDYDKMRKLASLVIAVDPKKLGTPNFANIMAMMVNELHQVQPVPGRDKVLAPNDLQVAYKQKCDVEGIPVPDSVYEFLND